MDGIKFEPIGKVKMSRSEYWKMQTLMARRAMMAVGVSSFILGATCGMFVAFYLQREDL